MYHYCKQEVSDELSFTTHIEIDKYALGLSIEQDFFSKWVKSGKFYDEGNVVSLLPEEDVAKLIEYLLDAYPNYKELL